MNGWSGKAAPPGTWTHGEASGIPASGVPAGGVGVGSARPPMPVGNALAVTHGARSPRVYGALAEELAAGLVADRPDLTAYPEAVAAWATAEAQAALLRRHVDQVGAIGDDGEPRGSALTWLVRLENLAARRRGEIGLTPFAEADLARSRATAATLSVNLDAVLEQGRLVLARQAAAGVDPPPDRAGELLAAAREDGAQRWAAAVAGHKVDHQIDHEVDQDHGVHHEGADHR